MLVAAIILDKEMITTMKYTSLITTIQAQKIEKIVQSFASHYYQLHPGTFKHVDTPFILAFSIVMLNTDLHNPVSIVIALHAII